MRHPVEQRVLTLSSCIEPYNVRTTLRIQGRAATRQPNPSALDGPESFSRWNQNALTWACVTPTKGDGCITRRTHNQGNQRRDYGEAQLKSAFAAA